MHAYDTIIVMGRSGSGKGTQISLLKDYLSKHQPDTQIFHFESGKHFRAFIKEEGYTNELMRDIIKHGTLAPDFITEWLLVNAFVKNMKKDHQTMILDGFPRTLNQARTLDSAMEYYKRSNNIVLHINVSEDEVRKRMIERGRKDDKDTKAINTRIDWYNNNVLPTIEYLETSPRYTVIDINGEQSIDEVHEAIIKVLNF